LKKAGIPPAFKKMKPMITSLLYGLAFLMGCGQAAPGETPPIEPRKVCEMPEALFELSGLTDIDATTLACVQDEKGVIYYYDLENCRVTHTVPFEGEGDFEGITRKGELLYVLRSDGTLFEVGDLKNGKPKIRSFQTKVPAKDNEGLAYDDRTDRLLIAPKTGYTDEAYEDKFRAVYAFDPNTGKMAEKPFLELSLATLEEFLLEQPGLELPRKKKTGELSLKLEFSGLAAHPTEDRVYLLLGPDGLLLTVDRNGKLLSARSLDKALLPQPEGLTLLSDHTLVLSSEGKKDGKATIALFEAPK
jgi:hypothetical protein